MNDFFFHRPWWLLALIPLVIMHWLLKRKKRQYSNWQEHIDSHLMPQVIQTLPGTKTNNLLNVYLMAWLIAVLVLAGPSWQKTPPITLKAEVAPLILILDLSRSMLVRDIYPDRLSIAKAKVQQLLQQLPPRPITLIVYSAMAHQVIPLTEDYQLVYNLLEFMHPDLMPAQASNSAAGFNLAAELLQQNAIPKADLLLLSDAADKNSLVVVKELSQQGHRTLVYAIGTENGAYIPDIESGYLRQNGQPVHSVLDSFSLQTLAQAGQGLYQEVTKNSDDIQHLLAAFTGINKGKIAQDSDGHKTTTQVWQDQAAWLIVLLLPLVLVLFRPGLLAIIVCFGLFISNLSDSPVVYAGSRLYPGDNADLPSLWLNQQQKAWLALQEKRYEEAENLFQSPLWRGIAQYKQQKYHLALESFSRSNTPEAWYNHGNTLVKLGRYQDALFSYQKALSQASDFQPARHNYDLLKKMLQQADKKKSQLGSKDSVSKQKKKISKKPSKQKPQIPQYAEDLLDGPKKSELKTTKDKRKLGLESLGSLSGGAIMIPDEGKDQTKEGASIGQGLSRGKQDLRQQDQLARKAQGKPSVSQKHEAKKIVGNKTLKQQPNNKTAAAKKTKESVKPQYSGSNSLAKAENKIQPASQKVSQKRLAKPSQLNTRTKATSGGKDQLSQQNKKEQQQFLKHWLKGIEDNPGELLKEVFKREYQSRLKNQQLIDNLPTPEQEPQPW